MGVEVAPGLAGRLRPARHRHRLEGSQPLTGAIVGEQELAAPERVVGTPAETVECDPEHRSRRERAAVLGQAGRDMGVMMLDLDHRQAEFATQLGRQIFGMPVDRDGCGTMIQQVAVEIEIATVVVEGVGLLEVALMLRQHGRTVLDQAESGLELAAERKQLGGGGEALGQRYRLGGIAARPAQQARPARHDPDHGVVDPVGDGPVMDQGVGGDGRQASPGIRVVDRLRLVGEVAAGHHHRACHAAQRQMMHGRGGQHEAQGGEPGCYRIGQALGPVRRQQDDRCGRRGQERLLFRADAAVAGDHSEVARHQCERLDVAALEPAQAADRLGTGGIAGELVAAQTLDGDDFALLQQAADGIDIVQHRVLVEADRPAVETDQRRPRPTGVAGDRLGMEAPVGGVLVLGAAGRAHGERRHGGGRPIVGQAPDDGQARAAVGAIGERVAVAAGEGIEHLGRTGRAQGSVGGDLGVRRAGLRWRGCETPRPGPRRRPGSRCARCAPGAAGRGAGSPPGPRPPWPCRRHGRARPRRR